MKLIDEAKNIYLPQYQLKADKYIFIGNSFEKKCFYFVSFFIGFFCIYTGSSVVMALLSGTNETVSGNIGGGIFVSIITLCVAVGCYFFAQSEDKYICLMQERLFLRKWNKYESIALCDIKNIVPIQKYVNGRFMGVYYSFLLEKQQSDSIEVKYKQNISEYFAKLVENPYFENAFLKILQIAKKS